MPKIFFVIGANGAGKTTIMNETKKLLPESGFELYDFDERGVPNNASKAGRVTSDFTSWICGSDLAK